MSGVKVVHTNQTDPEEIQRHLESRGYRTFIWHDPPGTYYPEHTHEDWEVRWVISGEVTIGTKDATYHLKPGDYLEMPPHTPHWAKTEQGVAYVSGSKAD